MGAVTNVRLAQTTSSRVALSLWIFVGRVLCCSLDCAAGPGRSKCWVVGWFVLVFGSDLCGGL